MISKESLFKVISHKPQTTQLFENPVLERLSHIEPHTPIYVFIPIILLFGFLSFQHCSISVSLAGIAIGLFLWTFMEYGIHRFLFHYHPSSDIGVRMVFMVHSVHHAYPRDSTRLVMPLIASIPATLLFYYLFHWLLGNYCFSVLTGMLSGYLFYDLLHYSIHHFNWNNRYFKYMKKAHLNHHYMDTNAGFGVTSPLWDYIFSTVQNYNNGWYNFLKRILTTQRTFLRTATHSTRLFYIATFITLVLLLSVTPSFLHFIQQRPTSITLNDPLLALFPPIPLNLTLATIFFSDLPLLFALLWLLNYPEFLLKGMVAYILMLSTRLVCMYLVPFNAPAETIPLLDPIIYGHSIITKDLFFSGHMATLMLCYLAVKNSALRIMFVFSIIFTAALLILQHQHYSIDLLIAPYISIACYVMASKLCDRLPTTTGR